MQLLYLYIQWWLFKVDKCRNGEQPIEINLYCKYIWHEKNIISSLFCINKKLLFINE